MSQIVTCVYNLGSSVFHAVAHALLRDLTNYYWHVEDDELKKLQELHSLIQELPTPETNQFIVEVTGKFTEITENSSIPSLKKASSKDAISTDNITANENTSHSENRVNLKQCILCLESPNDDSSNHLDRKSSEGLFEEDENNQIAQDPLKQFTCGDFEDSWAFTTTDHKSIKTDSENTIVESDVLQETSSIEGPTEMIKSEFGINDHVCDEFNVEAVNTDYEDDIADTNPKITNSAHNSLQENTEEPVLERSGLGIIETFSDVGSICFDDKFLHGLISEKPLECTKEEISTAIEASADMNERSKTFCCLHALYFDEGDDMKNDLLSENQLQTTETGSVSDWLYSVTGSPAVCLLRSDEVLSVTQEEIESIHEQEKIYEICQATDEIMLKQSYVNQWLIATNEYTCSKQLFGDGDFI